MNRFIYTSRTFLLLTALLGLSLYPIRISANELIADTTIMIQLRKGIDLVYNYEFAEAEETLEILKLNYPDHPVTPFFKGLIYYWKYYPLVPDKPGSEDFERLMEKSWKRAHTLKESNSEIEGVFFDLMARSFVVMYHADNGKSSRAISHMGPIYRDILKGFEMQDDFTEFMFITGLYNYYREAFPEAYPVYKPALIFFRKGDKEEGLKMLRDAAFETDFMKVEAALFLSLIHINFENNPDSALWYAEYLHKEYPGNAFFHSKHTEMLLINRQYDQALMQIDSMMKLDSYNQMKSTVYRGIHEEKGMRDLEKARNLYEKGLRLAEPYGERANYTKAYAYIGLSRYYSYKDDKRKAREYYKKAKNSTGYSYVFD
ncbi:tetratricopeptide repeat protein [Bacteroidota bacterium]